VRTQPRGRIPNQVTNSTCPIDIWLKVKGMKTLHDSFRDYVAVKTLNGEHRHQAGAFGLQDARAAVIFQSLPPVLHLQLKCYEYDVQCDAMVKVHIASLVGCLLGSNLTPENDDSFEFPLEIDLGEFLDETADRTEPWKYKLYGVLVHSGNPHGGHNFALIKPDRHTWWLKFDDDRVTPVTDRELLEKYGGEPLQRDHPTTMGGSTGAGVLVYIRKAAIDELMVPFTEGDTPPHLGELALGWKS